MSDERKREIVVPGEVIAKGDILPGEWTRKEGEEIVASRFGVVDKADRIVKIIPLSGVYIPRRGNVIIGIVTDITFNGWIVDIDSPYSSFLSLKECPRYINRNDLAEAYDIGEMVVAKVWSVKRNGIDLSVKSRGMGKINGGMIIKINPNKVPRVIGKEGSMINLIKNESGCEITVGQNGIIWLKGNDVEGQLLAKKAILLVTENSIAEGLTEKVEKFLKEEKK